MAVKSPNTLPSMERSVRTVRYENAALWNTPYPIMAMTKKKPENQIFWENVFAAYPTPYAPVIRHSVRKKPNRCEQPFVPRPGQRTQQGRNRQDDPRVFSWRAKSDDHERQQNGHAVIQSVHDHMENLQQRGGPVRKKTHVEPLIGWNPFAFQRIAYCLGSYVDDRAGSTARRA